MLHSKRFWNKKQLSTLLSVGLLIYMMISSSHHDYEIEGIITNAKPEAVWEFVADFSKMRALNPAISKFQILADHGHAHEWRYTVEYTEQYTYFPYWKNYVKADYLVTKTMPNVDPPIYAIQSVRDTCYIRQMYCWRTISDINFKATGDNTYFKERIRYQCPPFLNSICRRKLDFQRKSIVHNLTQIFSKPL